MKLHLTSEDRPRPDVRHRDTTIKPMKKTSIALLTLAVSISASIAGPQTKTFKETIVIEEPCSFRGGEFQLDLFTAGAWYNSGKPFWGGGLGVNYFFTEYIGIGVEQAVGGRGDDAEWATIGYLFLRYPICSISLAPYGMVGGGGAYGTGAGHGLGHVGGGLEYRLSDNIGLFSDARYVYSTERPRHAVLGRAGIRFAF